jgi:hypothetical protein
MTKYKDLMFPKLVLHFGKKASEGTPKLKELLGQVKGAVTAQTMGPKRANRENKDLFKQQKHSFISSHSNVYRVNNVRDISLVYST